MHAFYNLYKKWFIMLEPVYYVDLLGNITLILNKVVVLNINFINYYTVNKINEELNN